MAVHLLFLCVFYQAIITTSLGATLPFISLEAGVTPIQSLSLPPTGRTLPLSPQVPSRASDILTEYLKSRNSVAESPSSPTISVSLNSLPQVPPSASDILSNYLKSQYSENALSPTSSLTGKTQLSSLKLPSKASDVLFNYFKTPNPTTDWSPLPSFKTPLQTEPIYPSIKTTSSISLPSPAKSINTNTFCTLSYPSLLPVVDVDKTNAPKTYQPIYPPLSTQPSPNRLTLTSVTSLPTVSSDALKVTVDSLNQAAVFTSPLYSTNISPISECKITFRSLPSVNLPYSLPYPLPYKLLSLPKVVAPPVAAYPNQPLLPKLNRVFDDKSNSLNSKSAPKIPFSTNTCLKVSSIEVSDQTLTTDPMNPLCDQLVMDPVKPFTTNNLDILSRKTRPIIPNNVAVEPIEFLCKLNNYDNDGLANSNLNANLLKTLNALQIYSNDIETGNRITEIAEMLSSADLSIPNSANNPILNENICIQRLPNIMTDISSSSQLYYVPSYKQIIPTNYFNVSPTRYLVSTTSASSSVGSILSNIIYTYLPYLISTRRKPRTSAKVLPANPYSAPKRIQTSSINPKLILPIYPQATKNQMAGPLETTSTIKSGGLTSINSHNNDFYLPYFITYSPNITVPLAQVTPLVPLTVTWMPPAFSSSSSFVDYSPSKLCSHNLPSAVQQSNSELLPPVTVQSPPIMLVKSSEKSKSMERLLEFVCLAELVKGKGSVDWDAIDMAFALLSAI